LAQELLDLLKQKRELEVQMVAAVKALYKAYDAMHRELSVVLADRANDIKAARGE
jgi:vacuolar-type H+-ATPase subunit D/Vma8